MASPGRDGDPFLRSSVTPRSPTQAPSRRNRGAEASTSEASRKLTRSVATAAAARGAAPLPDTFLRTPPAKGCTPRPRASRSLSPTEQVPPPSVAARISILCQQIQKKAKSKDIAEWASQIEALALQLPTSAKPNPTPYRKDDLEEVKEQIALLAAKVGELTTGTSVIHTAAAANHKMTYAAATGGPSHSVIVSSTDKKQTSKDIREALRREVKPSSLKVGISALVGARDNKVIIKCPTRQDASKMRTAIPLMTKGVLTAHEGRRLKPAVILKGVEKDIKPEEVAEMILQQNDTIFEAAKNTEIKVLRTSQNRNNNLKNVIVSVSPDVRTAMLLQGRVCIGFQRVFVEDSCPLLQCFKCMGFGHTAARCVEKKDRCLHCAGEHKSLACTKKEIPAEHRCWNCHKMAKGRTVDAHRANSKTCPFRNKMLQRTMERMDY
jgi:hypothetical protein